MHGGSCVCNALSTTRCQDTTGTITEQATVVWFVMLTRVRCIAYHTLRCMSLFTLTMRNNEVYYT